MFIFLIISGHQVHALEVDLRHGHHGLFAPVTVPVYSAAVDDGRIHATTLTELTSSRTHGKNYVKMFLNSLQSEIVNDQAISTYFLYSFPIDQVHLIAKFVSL